MKNNENLKNGNWKLLKLSCWSSWKHNGNKTWRANHRPATRHDPQMGTKKPLTENSNNCLFLDVWDEVWLPMSCRLPFFLGGGAIFSAYFVLQPIFVFQPIFSPSFFHFLSAFFFPYFLSQFFPFFSPFRIFLGIFFFCCFWPFVFLGRGGVGSFYCPFYSPFLSFFLVVFSMSFGFWFSPFSIIPSVFLAFLFPFLFSPPTIFLGLYLKVFPSILLSYSPQLSFMIFWVFPPSFLPFSFFP